MPKLHPPRRRRTRSGEQAGVAGTPWPAEGLGAEAAAAAESAAQAEAATWVDDSGGVRSNDPPGWFRDEALGEMPDAAAGATPTVAAEAAPLDEPDAVDAGDVADEADEADEDDAAAESPPRTIYRTAPPPPEDAAARPRRRSPVVSALVGLLILVVVGGGGFGIGMLLPLLIPLPAGGASVASPAQTGAGPSATPGASAGSSPGATASGSPPASVVPSPAATPLVYVVKRGDQLARIANSFGVTLQAIEAANGITNPNLIVPGQTLVIPAPVASPSVSPSAAP
jgi:LysM repeat protein